jgi:hypothetical protein
MKDTSERYTNTYTPRILVIILAETRASELTWKTFKKHVLNALNADLAVCVSDQSPKDNPFMRAAKYTWLYPEPSDWAVVYDICSGGF